MAESINPTRGGRQTKLKCNCAIFSIMYQSHKGWTSNTIGTIYVAGDQAYQSHKGWTSNKVKMQLCYIFHHVSIPQGVDVKHDRYYICSRRSGVSIPQGVDVKQ